MALRSVRPVDAYPVVEAWIILKTMPGQQRAQEGDIIGIEDPHSRLGTGKHARALYMVLLIEGLENDEIYQLARGWQPESATEGDHQWARHRYCIPLDRLKEVFPSLNLTRSRGEFGLENQYQPFMQIEYDTGQILDRDTSPLDVHGLVFDKKLGRYL